MNRKALGHNMGTLVFFLTVLKLVDWLIIVNSVDGIGGN